MQHNFQKIKKYIINSYKILNLYRKSNRKSLIIILISIFLVSITPLIYSYILKLIIDKIVYIIKSGVFSLNEFIPLILSFIVIEIISRISWRLIEYYEKMSYLDAGKHIELIVEKKFATLGFEHFSNPKTNDLINRVRESYTWRPINFANRQIWIFENITNIISNTLAILTLNIWIFFFLILINIPELIIHTKYGRDVWNIHVAKGKIRRDYWNTSYYLQSENTLEEIRMFSSSNFFIKRIKNLYDTFFKEEKKKEKEKFVLSTISSAFSFIVMTFIRIFIILKIISGKLTLGSLGFYIDLSHRLTDNVNSFFRNIGISFEDLHFIQDLFTFLTLENKIKDKTNAVKINTSPKTIEFRNVYFRYPKSKKYVLKNFNLKIEKNEKIAIVGENGAGKTTIIKLLCRFFDVTKGHILIDGIDLRDIQLKSWFKCIGVLFQDFNRYAYTAKENILLGDINKKYNNNQIEEAAIKSEAHDFIIKFKRKYDTILSKKFQKGVEPSVGQWQKIALARAFFRDAPILILDEPTSSIDPKAEAIIFQNLKKFEKDKTVIMISHRFSTVRTANRILVIENGKIIEEGNHNQLMQIKNGKYKKLFTLQAKGYK